MKIIFKNYSDKILIFILFLFFSLRIYLARFTSLEQYPYFSPDSWSWLANGLYYAGYNTNMDYRPPIFPLIIAFFYNSGLENLIPIIGNVFSLLGAIGIYLLAARLYNKEIGVYSMLLFLMSGYLLGWSTYILADIIALTLIIYALYFFILGVSSNQNYFIAFGIISGISLLTQYIGLFIFFLVLAYLVFTREFRFIKERKFLGGMGLFALTSSLWFIYRWLRFGDPFYSGIHHISNLKFHVVNINILFYIWGSIVFISIICILLAIFGLLYKKVEFYKSNRFIVFWISIFFLFFAYVYSSLSTRFIMYWIVPVLILSSVGLWRIRKLNKIIFIIVLITALFSINLIRVPINSVQDIPIIPGYSLSTGYAIKNANLQTINFGYLIFCQNRENFLNNKNYSISPNIENLSTYIRKNSDKEDLIAIWTVNKEIKYRYTIKNQISALTRRSVKLITDSTNLTKLNVDFIVIEGKPKQVKTLEKGYETIMSGNTYTVMKKKDVRI